MSSDDLYFLDVLSSIPNEVRKYSVEITEFIEKNVNSAGISIREAIDHQDWLPSSMRPSPRHLRARRPPPPPKSFLKRTEDWILNNPAWTAAILGFVGTGCLLLYRSRKLYGKKRRAKRAANGAKKEIVVIAGSSHEPMTRSIAHDLERRGFIVFITVTSSQEEHVVQFEASNDIRPLFIDLTSSTPDPTDIHPSLNPIQNLLNHPQTPYPGVQPNVCYLSGLILLPSPTYPTGPLPTISASEWADVLNTRLLSPILFTQQFMPLISSHHAKNPCHDTTIVLLNPTISNSLAPPFSGPEVITTRGLDGWATSFRRELRLNPTANANVDLIQLKLGSIDLGTNFRQNAGALQPLNGTPLQSPSRNTNDVMVRGSPARELHNAVFDALAPRETRFGRRFRKRKVVYVGRGSWAYTVVGAWVPRGLVGWMLGLRFGYPDFGRRRNWAGDGGSEGGWEKVGI